MFIIVVDKQEDIPRIIILTTATRTEVWEMERHIDWGRHKKLFFFLLVKKIETPASPFFDHLSFSDKDFLDWPRSPPPLPPTCAGTVK